MDWGGGHMLPANYVDELLGHCSLDEAPHVASVGASTVSMFNEKLQVDRPFLGVILALRAMDASPKNCLSIPAR